METPKNESIILNAKARALIGCAAVFSVFYLLFSLSTMHINASVAKFLGSDKVSLFYALGLVTTALGFILYAFLQRKFRSSRVLFALFAILYAASMGVILFASKAIIIGALACPLAYGYMGGSVHDLMATALDKSKHKGKTIGIAFCATVIVQFFIQRLILNNIDYAFILFVALMILLWRSFSKANISLDKAVTKSVSIRKNELWSIVAAIFCVALMVGMYDGMAAELHARNAVNLAGWTRLMVGVGALAAGFIFDMKIRTPMNVTVLLSALIIALAILVLSSTDNYALANLLFTFGTGFYMVYALVSFIDIAPKSAFPSLFAGMGSITHSLAMSITASLAGVFSAMPPVTLEALAILLFSIALIIFVFCGKLGFTGKANKAEANAQEFIAAYRLTPREAEVFLELLEDDGTNASIASKLGISVRVFQRYVASIYEKAGVQSRVGLVKLYYGK